jgi:hypothetical protein
VTLTQHRPGFGVAMTIGTVVTLGAFGAAIGVTAYNQQWIDEYNQYASAFDFYRTRNVARAQQLQAQGREHLRVIEDNESLARGLFIAGGVGAAVTLGMLIFWPREAVPARRSSLRLHVFPTPGGLSVAGTF